MSGNFPESIEKETYNKLEILSDGSDLFRRIGLAELFVEKGNQRIESGDYRTLCKSAGILLRVLGEEFVLDTELKVNGRELRTYIHHLKILAEEGKQDKVDESVVRIAFQGVRSNSDYVVGEMVEYYELWGSVVPKIFR
jgi:hypothetical protein